MNALVSPYIHMQASHQAMEHEKHVFGSDESMLPMDLDKKEASLAC